MLVSYLVPSFNHGRFVLASLDSILADSRTLRESAELIVIDDGSKDDSAALIAQWCEQHRSELEITFRAQSNAGIGATLNRLVESARGEFLRLCSSDDLVEPGSTDLFLRAFEESPGALCVVGDGEQIDDRSNPVKPSSIEAHGGRKHRLLNPATIRLELIRRWCVSGPSLLIRKQHYARIRYAEGSNIDDYHLFLSLLETPGAVRFVDAVTCRYRIHDSNTSKSPDIAKRLANQRSFLGTVDHYLARGKLDGPLLPVRHKTLAKIAFLEKRYAAAAFRYALSVLYGVRKDA